MFDSRTSETGPEAGGSEQQERETTPGGWRRVIKSFRRGRPLAVAATLALLPAMALVACGDDDDTDSAEAASTTVKVTEGDGTIDLDRTSSADGSVQFVIENGGELTHEFLVLKTDLAQEKLPLNGDQTAVDEAGSGVDLVGEKSAIAPGADATLSFDDLAPGKYVLICNVPGHYGLGMHASFAVS